MQTDYEILKTCRRQLQNFLPWGSEIMGVGGCNIEQFFIVCRLISYYWWEVIIFHGLKFLPRISCSFRSVWQDLHPKFWNHFEKNHEGGTLPPWKDLCFPEILLFMKQNSCFQKVHWFLCNARQFLSVCDNFLVLVKDIVEVLIVFQF